VHAAAGVHVPLLGAEGATDAPVRVSPPEEGTGDLLEVLAAELAPAGELARLGVAHVGGAVAFHRSSFRHGRLT
jgi:hypothetical protein